MAMSAYMRAAVAGMLRGANAQLHTGDPGPSGTANMAAETRRQPANFSAFDGTDVSLGESIRWSQVAADETFTHVSLWDAAGNHLHSAELDPPKRVDAGDDYELSEMTVSLL